MKKLFLIILLFTCITTLQAKKETISKSYNSDNIQQVNINSKYGKIIVENWDKNEIGVEVIISADSNKPETIDKMLRNVDVTINKANNTLDIDTSFGSFFSFMKLTNSLFKDGDFAVDYFLKIPKHIKLDISLNNGDIILFERDADVKIKHNSGYISSQSIHGKCKFDLRDSNLKISHIDSLSLQSRGTSIIIDKAKYIWGKSYNTLFDIEEVEILDIESMRDTFSIKEVSQMLMTSTLSDVLINKLGVSGIFNPNYGSITLKNLERDFDELKINSKGAKISLGIKDTPSNVAISHGSATKTEIPKRLGLSTQSSNSNKEFITTGTIGEPSNNSEVLLNLKGGSITLN